MDEIGGDPGASPLSGGLMPLLDKGDRLLERIQNKIPLWDRLPFSPTLTSRGLLLACTGLLLLLLLPPLMERVLRKTGRVQRNFRGDVIPQSFGLVIVLWAGVMLGLAAWLLPGARDSFHLWLVAVVGIGLLGFADDIWGDSSTQGLRGHFRAALRERKITTGFIKAVGGGLLALWLGWRLYPASPLHLLLAAALIALAANAINLLDLRPGRAGAVFLLVAFAILYGIIRFGESAGIPPLLFVFVPALVVWERDARARVMLGDAGSNTLGAALGLALAQSASSRVQVAVLLLLIALHIIAERSSLTKLIEANRLLRSLDRLSGVR
jgi:UDP-N-acetylmuramyl pentapeptide phosphotransferase/UDP-N-acetylglucosamine-1-phosphate transferase